MTEKSVSAELCRAATWCAQQDEPFMRSLGDLFLAAEGHAGIYEADGQPNPKDMPRYVRAALDVAWRLNERHAS